MKVRAFVLKDWGGSHRLGLVRDAAERGKIEVLAGFVWEKHDEGAMFDPNAGEGSADDMIQQIMDRAWEAGFRPNGFGDVKNETDAIRSHLADMKAIAFHGLKIKA